MGTRADFYVGRGPTAEWLGSIAWDGHPRRIDAAVKQATTPDAFRSSVASMLAARDDATLPTAGWPWSWEDSRTTDYAYALDEGKVWASHYGHAWFDATAAEPEGSSDGPKVAVFPNMSQRRSVAEPGTKRSGVMLIGRRPLDVAKPQPSPQATTSAEVWPLIIHDLERGHLVDPALPGAGKRLAEAGRARDAFGRKKYGVPLQVDNGRAPLADAAHEALDLMAYTRQHYERLCLLPTASKEARLTAWKLHLSACAVAALMLTEAERAGL